VAAGTSHTRYRRILWFAARVLVVQWWFELMLPRIGLAGLAARGRARRLQRTARRFHDFAVQLGGLMIKSGQFLSARMDVLPPEITDELAGLQDEVAPVPTAEIRRAAAEDLGRPLETAFAWFDDTPIAAASLGQAHRARLSPALVDDTGLTDVVVKVQRPGIEEIVEIDLAALRRVGRWVSRVRFVSDRVDAPALVEEFAVTCREEIDYLHEGANAERFAENFADDPRVRTPEVVWERTTRCVLTLSDVTAIKVNDTAALRASGIDPSAVADALAQATFRQLFIDGFFHADPHPGNIFVTSAPGGAPDGSGEGESEWALTYIDFGMIGEISPSLKQGLREAIIAAVARDGKGLVSGMRKVGALLPSADTAQLERAMSELFDRFGGMGIGELQQVDPRELADFGERFQDTIRTMPFQLPENFLLIIRAVSLVSGLCSALDPDFNMWNAVEPFAADLVREQGQDATRTIARQAMNTLTAAARLPQRLDDLTRQVERGQLQVQTPGANRRIRELNRTTGRIVSAVVFAGLVIAGALLRATDPVLGIVLMGASAVPLLHAVLGGIRLGPRR